jgi:hypothetical protein
MDINKIFDLFTENNPDNTSNENISDLHSHPLFWVGMFEKIIKNSNVIQTRISELFESQDLNNSGYVFTFNKAYSFISKIDINNIEHQKALLARNKHDLISIITSTIDYFSGQEEYEKCAFLKKIQTFLEKSLAT